MGTQIQDMAAAARRVPGTPPAPRTPEPDDALRNALATNLRAARLATGLTQKQLADLANVSRSYIMRIENRLDANVSIGVISNLARHVGKKPLELLGPPAAPPKRRS
jgi:DNA-binding XRE family transcriptional regulator